MVEGPYDYDGGDRYYAFSAKVVCAECGLSFEVDNDWPKRFGPRESMWDFAIEAWNERYERTCRSEDGYCSQCGTQLANFFKRYTDEEGFTWGCKPYCPGCGARVTNDD